MDVSPVYAALKETSVLVTGAAGFIGRPLCAALIRAGARVTALRRPESRAPAVHDERIAWLEADIRDGRRLTEAVRRAAPQRVFHLAATTSVERGFSAAEDMIAINLQGTINLLQALEGTDYACFIQTGSAEEYGAGEAPFHESSPLRPVSAYSASKAAATLFCEMYRRTLGCPIVVLRPFLVYGPGQPPDKLIPEAVLAALDDRPLPMTTGRQTREFTYIDDLVDGYLRASVRPQAIGQTINLGTGIAYPVIDVVRMIIRMTGSKMTPRIGALPTRPCEIWTYRCDNAKARTLLDWTPQVSLQDGLRRTIDWYRRAAEQGHLGV